MLLFAQLIVLLPKLELSTIVLERLLQEENSQLTKSIIIPELKAKIASFKFAKTYPYAPFSDTYPNGECSLHQYKEKRLPSVLKMYLCEI